MNRRSFTKTAVATVLGGVVAGNTFGVSKASDIAESSAPYKSKFAPHFGMLKASMTKAGIDVKKDFVSQLQFFHDCGFRALEDNGMMKRPVEVQEAIAKKMEQLGWEMGVFCAHTEWKLASFSGNRLDTKVKKVKGVIVRNPKEVREMLVAEMEKAIEEDGVNLLGYTPWGCIDLISAGTGEMKKRYGFIYIDMDDQGNGTLNRYKKASFEWYKKVIASNGKDLD